MIYIAPISRIESEALYMLYIMRFPWTSYVAPKPPKGAQKRKGGAQKRKTTARKIALHLKKVCYKVRWRQ